ncbi:MAG: hypothetical protein WBB85_10790 [Albidovulum sp.]|uniref:hypothetical protein n=1 Tax=Albidovulum sp. TaxID=1872424 RepID=UPI003CAB618D
MTSHRTLDTSEVQQPVVSVPAATAKTQSAQVRSLMESVVANDWTGADGLGSYPIQTLRDRYDRSGDAYLNGAICKIEYAHIIDQINQVMASVTVPEDLVSAGGAPMQTRNGAAKAKARRGNGIDAKSDAGFATIVHHTGVRLVGRV